MLGQISAEHRASGARQGEHRSEIATEAAALAWQHVLADDGLRRGHEATATESLQGARNNERVQRWRQCAGNRGQCEDRQCRQQQPATTKAVPQMSVDRRRNRRRQEIRHHHPGQIGDAAHRAGDGRQRARENRLVRRRQEHRHHDPGKYQPERFLGGEGCALFVPRAGGDELLRDRIGRHGRTFVHGRGLASLCA